MLDSRGRHAPGLRSPVTALAVILAVAAALRLYRIGTGIPFAIGIDEPELLVRAVRMMQSGDFNPHFFDYPSLPIYFHLGVAILRFLVGAMSHEFRAVTQADFTDFLLWSRVATATLGVLTVYVTYRIGQHWGRWHGVLAAALFAVLPMHVREARFALTDTPMTLCAAGALWAAIVAYERGTVRAYTTAAVVAGLALGVKYTAGLVVMLPLVAVWASTTHVRVKLQQSTLVIVVWAATFLLVAPYTVLDLPAFLNGFAELMNAYRDRPMPEAPWLTYLKHLRIAFAWPGIVAIVIGMVVSIVQAVRGPARARWLMLAVYPLAHYAALADQNLVFARYLLPIMPSLCLIVAVALIAVGDRLRQVTTPTVQRTVMAGLVVAVIATPILRSANFAYSASLTSTQAEAYRWLVARLAPGNAVVIEKYEIRVSGTRYRPVYVTRLIERSYADYVATGARYMVATSQMYGMALAHPEQEPARYRAYMELFNQANEVARFTPADDRPGPEIRIFDLAGPQAR